jgi:TP901 family phage tail tape measure protein
VAVANVDVRVNSGPAVGGLRQIQTAAQGATAAVASLVASLGAGFALQQIIRTASQFESSLSEIGKTAGSSEVEIKKLAQSLKQLSAPSRTNLAPSVLAEGVKDLVAQGLKLDDAVASIETLGKVAVATNSELTDVTKTGFQLQSALKIRPTELKATFDALAFAGKAGAFELKDMAQFMPTIAAAASSLGIQGKDGAVALASMMQVVRKDAPGAAEASTRLTDALLKMTAPDAVKNFAKFGVNIEKVLKDAVAKGVNPMEAAVKELQRVTGGDAFKLSQIFGDKEAKLALMSLMKYREEYEKLKAAAGGGAAAGTVQADFEASLKTFSGQLQSLTTSGELLALSLGNVLLPILARLIEEILPIVDAVGRFVEGIKEVPKPILDAAVGIGKFILQLMLVDKAIKIAIGTAALFKGAMLLLTTQTTLAGAAALTGQARLIMLAGGIKGAGTAAAMATPALSGALGVLARLGALGIISIGVNIVVTGLMQLADAQARIDKLRGQKDPVGAMGPTPILTAARRYTGATKEKVQFDQRAQLEYVGRLRTELSKLQAAQTKAGGALGETAVGNIGNILGGFTQENTNAKITELNLLIKNAEEVLNLDPNKFQTEAEKLRASVTSTPTSTGVTPTGKTKGGGKAADEAKRLAAAIAGSKSQLALTKAQFEIEGKMLQAQQDDDKALQIRLTAQGKFAGIRQQIADIRADKEMKAEQKLLEIQNQEILGLGVAREMVFGLAEFQKTEDQRKLDAVKAYLEKQYELNTSVQQQLQLADSVSGILGQGMTSAFDALIQGSEDFGKSLRNIASGALVDIAKQLIRIYIIEQAINSIKSFLTPFSSATPLGAGGGQVGRFGTFGPNYGIKQFAAGGTPPVGRPSLVGERGPELFMPGVRGSIIPNHALGGGTTNVVVNVDASGSSVEGDQAQAKALGNAISAAVQSELVKQKRPGGLLA